jgi:hypothetical protein
MTLKTKDSVYATHAGQCATVLKYRRYKEEYTLKR